MRRKNSGSWVVVRGQKGRERGGRYGLVADHEIIVRRELLIVGKPEERNISNGLREMKAESG
jgi:hypothetical protein